MIAILMSSTPIPNQFCIYYNIRNSSVLSHKANKFEQLALDDIITGPLFSLSGDSYSIRTAFINWFSTEW